MERMDVEVIVQDNSDNHEDVESFIVSLNNPNIKYYYDSRKLSQTENSDVAFKHVTGDYAVYIGDDDTICKSLVDLAYALKRHSIDSATYEISTFNWPDLMEAVPGSFSLRYYAIDKCLIKQIDPKETLLDALHDGMQDITFLPRVYHGIVSKNLLTRIYEQTNGTFFPGPSPDMANASSCAILANNMVSINIPMIISGFGKTSAGGMGRRKLHKGSLKGNFQLRDDVEDTWDQKIPKLWMQSTIWPNSASTALRTLGETQLLKQMNYGVVAAETLLHDRSSLQSILECKLSIRDYCAMTCRILERVTNRFIRRKKMRADEMIEMNPMSIQEAVDIQNDKNDVFNIEELFDTVMGNGGR